MKNPVKVPEWYKELTGKSEAAGSGVEITALSIDTSEADFAQVCL